MRTHTHPYECRYTHPTPMSTSERLDLDTDPAGLDLDKVTIGTSLYIKGTVASHYPHNHPSKSSAEASWRRKCQGVGAHIRWLLWDVIEPLIMWPPVVSPQTLDTSDHYNYFGKTEQNLIQTEGPSLSFLQKSTTKRTRSQMHTHTHPYERMNAHPTPMSTSERLCLQTIQQGALSLMKSPQEPTALVTILQSRASRLHREVRARGARSNIHWLLQDITRPLIIRGPHGSEPIGPRHQSKHDVKY